MEIGNSKIPNSIIRRIIEKAPTYTVSENYGRSGGFYGDSDEYAKGYKSICIYVQNGLADKTELFKIIAKAIFQIQRNNSRKYPLLVFGFGDTNKLQHENKYFDFGYLNDAFNDNKVAKTISRISGNKTVRQAIIPELFPKTDIRSLYSGKTKIEKDDLLIIIGRKNEVFFESSLELKLKQKIRKHILYVEIEDDKVNFIFKNYNPILVTKKSNNMNSRTGDFKIGTFHGTLNPNDESKEAKLRNALFLIGNLYLSISKKEGVNIRIIGYEIPIEYRGKRIDLIGYDKDMNPWIIELKAHDSKERISDVVKQINGYEKILVSQLSAIQNEFKERFFLNLSLSEKIQKMILAPREFYKDQDKASYPKMQDIVLCSIARMKEVFKQKETKSDKKMFELTLDSKFNELKEIRLKIENR